MTKERIQELDQLFRDIGTYRQSYEFQELLNFVKRFPHIAPYNAMLVHIQKPGSSYVASASEWQRSFNRSIKPGARPLLILKFFGPVTFVFDLSDTEGAGEFPEYLLNPFEVQGKIPGYFLDIIEDNMKCYGIKYYEVDHGTNSAGLIRTSKINRLDKIYRNHKEILVEAPYEMLVNRNHPIETRFATIIHELGHLFNGHLGNPVIKKARWWNDRRMDLNAREFEAECTCWLVCERMGIKNPSAQYLSDYLYENDEIPNISIDSVLKSTGKIEAMLKNPINPQKEIVKEIIAI